MSVQQETGEAGASAIGGYFSWDIPAPARKLHPAFLNCGRNALALWMRHNHFPRIWLPAYICPVIPETIQKAGGSIHFYHLDRNLEPEQMDNLRSDDVFLYVNYFGVKDEACRDLAGRLPNLVLDLTQAFFMEPPTGVVAFNSARKFFPVPDGAAAWGLPSGVIERLPRYPGTENALHLLLRAEGRLEEGYQAFHAAEEKLIDAPPARISLLSERLLEAADWESIIRRRRENFMMLAGELGDRNELSLPSAFKLSAPMTYPLLIKGGASIRKKLCSDRIFIPQYWPGLDSEIMENNFEKRLIHDLVCLPVDQRYGPKEIKRITERVKQYVS